MRRETFEKIIIYIITLIFCLAVWLIVISAFIFIKEAHACDVDQTKAVIHHTASHDVSAATIDDWHKERGWDGIGYHYVIRKDGTIEEGRDSCKIGAHAKGRNNYLGIVLTGYDVFTSKQIKTLKSLLLRIGVTHIEGHHEHCPGEGLNLNEIQRSLK
jgi:hypothetical protein